jgi:hypothetical protein
MMATSFLMNRITRENAPGRHPFRTAASGADRLLHEMLGKARPQADDAHEDEIDPNDHIEKAGNHQDEDARDKGNHGLQHDHTDHHGNPAPT